MTNSFSPAMQISKVQLLEWLASKQDEISVQEIVSFVKKHTYKQKAEKDFLKPMTEQELYQKVKNAIESADNGRVISTTELRERAKTWSR